jgi:hypothetical protein
MKMGRIIICISFLFAFFTATSQIYTSQIPFNNRVALGEVPGWSTVSKFGENPEITTGTDPEDVWDAGGLYTYSDTSDIKQIASSAVADSQLVIVYGLDSLWRDTFQIVTLQGQTPQNFGFRFRRVYRMINIDTTNISGTVTVITASGTYTNGVPDAATDIRAQIVNGNNQTLMTQYTIPANTTGLFTGAIIGMTTSGVQAQTAIFQLYVRPFGQVFQLKQTIALVGSGTSAAQLLVFNPLNIPEKSDIVIRISEVSATLGVSASYGITLVED